LYKIEDHPEEGMVVNFDDKEEYPEEVEVPEEEELSADEQKSLHEATETLRTIRMLNQMERRMLESLSLLGQDVVNEALYRMKGQYIRQ
jgi:hypothetical protein